jgi:hypothetical protein
MRLEELVSQRPESVLVFDTNVRQIAPNEAMRKMALRPAPLLTPDRTFAEIDNLDRVQLLNASAVESAESGSGVLGRFEGRTPDGRNLNTRMRQMPAGEQIVFCSTSIAVSRCQPLDALSQTASMEQKPGAIAGYTVGSDYDHHLERSGSARKRHASNRYIVRCRRSRFS